MSMFSSWPTSPGGRVPLEIELQTPPEVPDVRSPLAEPEFVDRGMEIPASYGIDVVRALVQDPFHLLVYWELRPESLRALAGIFPDGSLDEFRPAMRLTDVDEGYEAYVAVPLSGKYWFATSPDRGYRIEIGARSEQFGFVPIVRSAVVRTPRGTVAPEVDEDPRFAVDTPRFVRLLAATGFATDKVLSEVARVEAARADGEPVETRGAEAPAYLADAFAKLPAPIREAAGDVARGGSITSDHLERLPDWLRRLLASLRDDDADGVATAAFMHLLPQMLRQALEHGFVADGHHPFHLPPRFAIGSSEAVRRPRVDWRWMPSMVETLRSQRPGQQPDPLEATVEP